MTITVHNGGKKYNREWVFKDLNYTFESDKRYAITGANGSGKSTLLQIISGYQLLSAGKITYACEGKKIEDEKIFQYISLAAPYMDLIEEFTLAEQLNFHFKFRKIKHIVSPEEIMEDAYLLNSKNKFIKNFSSGMKQRLKLALAFYTQSKFIFLDEPTSNLDYQGIDWYNHKIEEVLKTETGLVIASNQEYEYKTHCPDILEMAALKE